jgi:histidyl-tRNA synthetase
LRYDLTVPFARFVVMYQNDLSFPFKRYQIQPVWRADRPQKGRYQEFYQCDVDVVGSTSLSYEAELVQIYDEVFAALQIKTITRINNRKILAGIAEVAGIPDQMIDMTVAIDKLDKIGIEGVRKELSERGIPSAAITTIERILAIQKLEELREALATSETGLLGVEEIMTVMDYLDGYELRNRFEFDITLARGLSYYTGCIFEANVDTTAHPKIKMGSIGGGGRYEDLTSMFGMRDMSGVGVSFGAERIYDVLEELDLFPAQDDAALKVLLIAFDEVSHRYAFRCLNALRAAGINADLYPDPIKLNKQMKYANDRQVPYTIVIGDNEMESGKLAFKNMQSREQNMLSLDEIIEKLSA